MQRLLEQSPRNSASAAARQRAQLFVVLGCVVVAAWLAFFVLPAFDETTISSDRISGVSLHAPIASPPRAVHDLADGGHSAGARPQLAAPGSGGETSGKSAKTKHVRRGRVGAAASNIRPSDIRALEPWGYNAERNPERWRAIGASIKRDVEEGLVEERFTLVDYGADAGYFSISTAHEFPKAFVIAVELGGTGGVIWKTKNKIDVHQIQESQIKAKEIAPGAINLCQTTVRIEHFAQLRELKQFHTYQLVLSVFHWFEMPNRAEFERVVVDLFANARTTFIEMPTIGDDGPIIRRQTGYKYWSVWYAGRTDVAEILRAAIAARGMTATVTTVASLPWAKWTRVVYRVDVLDGADQQPLATPPAREKDEASAADPFSAMSFSCEKHRQVYGCKPRELYQSCPAAGSSGLRP